jgi:hypothetical protein
VDLFNPGNAVLGRSRGVGTIINDDGLPGQLHHFTWSTISMPQSNGVPFAVTITAQDYFNNTANSFNGTVVLSGVGSVGEVTNSILGNPVHSATAADLAYTVGYAFTPSANITVTHVRHYFGTKVSIWTDAGATLASQPVASVPGTWVETPLTVPLALAAGTRYRIGVYYPSAAGYYWRTDGTNTFSNGTIDQSYEGAGDSFPNDPDGIHWWFVDLRYTAGLVTPFPITPAISGSFANGAWAGNLTALQTAAKVVLRADDGQGHLGYSNPFDVIPVVAELRIEPAGNLVILSWPAALSDLVLESTSIPWSESGWLPITNSPFVVGNRNTVTNIISGTNMFYRLKKP